SAEIRRQIHIQSEQKRRAQIKDGFEELKRHLPNCNNKKISKAAILSKTVQHLEQVKEIQMNLTAQLQQMKAENERLRRFYEIMAQGQHFDKAYPLGL
ncbi:HLH-domain-containing protein, partial [Basidiobolus meristosporus CBS 931.73]